MNELNFSRIVSLGLIIRVAHSSVVSFLSEYSLSSTSSHSSSSFCSPSRISSTSFNTSSDTSSFFRAMGAGFNPTNALISSAVIDSSTLLATNGLIILIASVTFVASSVVVRSPCASNGFNVSKYSFNEMLL